MEEARDFAKRFHRSLTGQIEHWAALGMAIEARLTTAGVASLLEEFGNSLKITDATQPDQRKQVVEALTGFLTQSPEAKSQPWLVELNAQGIPLYGTKAGSSEIIRRDPDGEETLVHTEKATTAH